MVAIQQYAENDVCLWCSKEREGVLIECDDQSFSGFLCFADLKRFLRIKTGPDRTTANGRKMESQPEGRQQTAGA